MCSEHFANARGRRLRPDEALTLELPSRATKISSVPPRRAIIRHRSPTRERLELLQFGTKMPQGEHRIELTGANVKRIENQLQCT